MNIPHKIKQLENKLGVGFDVYFLSQEGKFKIEYYCVTYNLWTEILFTFDQFCKFNLSEEKTIEEIKMIMRCLLIDEIKKEINKELGL